MKRKYQLGGRESQIASTNQGLTRQQGKPKSFLRDMGNLYLDSITAPIESLIGQDLVNPEYSTKFGEIGSKVADAAGKIGTSVGTTALNMIAPGLGTGINMGGKLIGDSLEQSKLQFKTGGMLEEINGPSHEMGGMAITPNAEAEGGETKVNDYIFSDYLKPKGSKQTFAQKSKNIAAKFKLRPNDKLSKEAQQKELMDLQQEQEVLRKELQEAKLAELNTMLNPDYSEVQDMVQMRAGGKIHIDPSKKGSFTRWSKQHHMGVQEAARHVMANKDKYSTAITRKANFALNASKWHHKDGGYIMSDSGEIPINKENNIVYDNIISSTPDNSIPPVDKIFEGRVKEIGFKPALDEYETYVLKKQTARLGGYYRKGGNTNPFINTSDELVDFSDLEQDTREITPESLEANTLDADAKLAAELPTIGLPQRVNMEGYIPFGAKTQEAVTPVTNDVLSGNVSKLPLISNIAGNAIKAGMLAGANKGRLTPNIKMNYLNAQPALDIAQQNTNNALASGFNALKNNAISSGQFIGNANTMGSIAGSQAGATMADILNQYQNANVGISNEQALRNNAIAQSNNLIQDESQANTINQAANLIDNTIGGVQQYGKDLQTQNYYDTAMNNLTPAGAKIIYVKNAKGRLVPKVVYNNEYINNSLGSLI